MIQQGALQFHNDSLVAGVDEAGRGPLAGPVVASAVILDGARPIDGLTDSKQLTAQQRERLAPKIRRSAVAWSVAWADAAEIDSINILWATMLAMRRALTGLGVPPRHALVDGNRLPDLRLHHGTISGEAIIGGDARVASISAASILAKTTRDDMMVALDRLYPEYGFARHKGYGTRLHIEQLSACGPCVAHRQTFAPVRMAS